MQKKEYKIQVNGKELVAEFNDLAIRANSSVLMRYGETVILVTAVMGGERDLDYFPLSVEYEEKFYASGAILGSRFQRREGRPSDEAILSARIVDRTIRPLFDHNLRRDVQVVITVLSLGEDDPDVLAVIGASLALGTSSIPWNGPVSAVRLGLTQDSKDEFIINPTYLQRDEHVSRLDLLACGKDGLINMIEIGASEVEETTIEEGLKKASQIHEELNIWQKQIIEEIGKEKFQIEKREYNPEIIKLSED
jgi:polyribonucleotide nucleotidyltransferase